MVKCSHPFIAYADPNDPTKGRINTFSAVKEIGWNYLVGTASGYISDILDGFETGNRFLDLGKTYLSQRFKNKKGATTGPKGEQTENQIAKAFPWFGAIYDFRKGSTKIKTLYTAEFEGCQTPVYATIEGENDPNDEQLLSNIRFLKGKRYSPYQSSDEAKRLFREGFKEPGANHMTNEDYPNYVLDPVEIEKWFVRDEMWMVAMDGKEAEFETGGKVKEMDGLKIRKYSRPSDWQLFYRWETISLLYKSFDPMFRPAKFVSENTIGSTDKFKNPINEFLFELQYKGTTGAFRALTRRAGRMALEFDFRQKSKRTKIKKTPKGLAMKITDLEEYRMKRQAA